MHMASVSFGPYSLLGIPGEFREKIEEVIAAFGGDAVKWIVANNDTELMLRLRHNGKQHAIRLGLSGNTDGLVPVSSFPVVEYFKEWRERCSSQS